MEFRQLLDFERTSRKFPIELFWRNLSQEQRSDSGGRKSVAVYVHSSFGPKNQIDALVGDEVVSFETSIAPVSIMADDDEAIGFEHGGRFHTLAGVTGNRVTVYFDVVEAIERETASRRVVPGGTPFQGNIWNAMFDMIVGNGIAKAISNIQTRGWKTEEAMFRRGAVAGENATARRIREEIRNNERSIQEHRNELAKYCRSVAEQRIRLKTFLNVTPVHRARKSTEQFNELLRMWEAGAFEDMQFSENRFSIFTNPVKLEDEDNDFSWNMGKFEIRFFYADESPTVHEWKDNSRAGDYYHPHVSTSGVPCLGNIEDMVSELVLSREYSQLVVLMLQYIKSYEPSNPYTQLTEWDPDWQNDEDRYETCREGSGYRDCAVCGDRDCPYLEEAPQQCRSNYGDAQCAQCRRCDEHEAAADSCLSEGSCSHCRQCDSNCILSEEWNRRVAAHASECAECGDDECPHWADAHPSEEKEEDDDNSDSDDDSPDQDSDNENSTAVVIDEGGDNDAV